MATELTLDNFFEFVTENKVVIIDFYANWCQPCQQFLKLLPRVEEDIMNEAVIGKVEIDENPILKDAYGVTKVPTFLLFVDGVLRYRHEGTVMKRTEIKDKVKELNG